MVVEDKDNYIPKSKHQIAEGENELAKGKEKTILTHLHRKLMNQLKSMGVEALLVLIKVHMINNTNTSLRNSG